MLHRRTPAFTLIELMIVIGIIAILAGIMVPNYMQARREANIVRCEQNMQAINTAIQTAKIRHPEVFKEKHADITSTLYEMGYLGNNVYCDFSNSGYGYDVYYDNSGGYIYHTNPYAGKDHGIDDEFGPHLTVE